MILQNLKIFCQNVCKNCLLTDIILENNKNFDIIFIQKPPWSVFYTISSASSKKDEEICGTSNHLS